MVTYYNLCSNWDIISGHFYIYLGINYRKIIKMKSVNIKNKRFINVREI